MPTYFVTGATSGLGLRVATLLLQDSATQLILPVRNTERANALRQALGDAARRVTTPTIDLSSLASVAAFLREPGKVADGVGGVLFNAGVQSASALEMTSDGYESTFAVNHLAHHLLMRGLTQYVDASGTVGWTASGTHDPNEKSARLSGFRGAQYKSAEQVAMGDYGTGVSATQACRDAYATSKLCNIVSAIAFAKELPNTANFFSFDPGLMPGTGLARKQGAAAQWVWKNVLPAVSFLLPGTSTPEKSAAILVALLTKQLRGSRNGAYFNYANREQAPVLPLPEDVITRDLLRTSDRMILPFVQTTHA